MNWLNLKLNFVPSRFISFKDGICLDFLDTKLKIQDLLDIKLKSQAKKFLESRIDQTWEGHTGF